jgi:heparan-alpha-glucosaminide N-acetyltransferase
MTMTIQDASQSVPPAAPDSPPDHDVQPPAPPKSKRLVSLDAYRGATMLLMASGGLGLATVAKEHPDSNLWQAIAHHTNHVPWTGCVLWDMIQPAFMFIVGVALPFSIANRIARGQGFTRMFAHALWRALLLVLIAVFLSSAWSRQTNWSFANVLAQIGLGYPILFLLAYTRPRTQWLAAAGILLACWIAFVLYPVAPENFDWKAVGVPADWPHLTGIAAHWDKNANFAAAFDHWFLNLFPRLEPFTFNRGGYATLNFVPAAVTMIFGLLAGWFLRGARPLRAKLGRLALFGLAGVVLGQVIAWIGICPIVKRIWTPSWTLYSAGWATLILVAFIAVIEWLRLRRWAYPFVVIGVNPIAVYCLWQLMGSFIRDNVKRHLGQDIFAAFGEPYTPMLERLTVLIVLFLIALYMHRRKIYIRI